MTGKSRFGFLFLMVLCFIVVTGCPPPTGPDNGDPGNGGTPLEPEIQLWQEGTPVGMGANHEIGNVCNNTACTVTFTIKNVGTDDLNLTGVSELVAVSGADASLFTIATEPSTPIATNDSSSFTVRFFAASSGEKNATLSIENDDPDANPFTLDLTATGFEAPVKVPATGQTTSYAAGDDGDLQAGVSWPASRFTDNQDGTVTDTLTGLMWEQTPSGTLRTWTTALNYANNLTLGGYTDWRLANIRELQSLINAEQSDPAAWLRGLEFSSVGSVDYWSSTTSPYDFNMACILRMYECGWVIRTTKTILATKYAWAVRDGQPGSVSLPKSGQTSSYSTGDDGDHESGVDWPSPRFRDNGDGTITDNLTGLVWEQSPLTTKKTWADALSYADDLTLGEYSDWRLANKNELWSLIHYGHWDSSSWLWGQGFAGVQSGSYWTSTTYAGDTDHAWVIYMESGNTVSSVGEKTTASNYAWAVRGGD